MYFKALILVKLSNTGLQ